MIDEAVIAELYERYGHALYRRCKQLVTHEEDAQELLQEVFYQFWKGRERFEGRSSAFTYLYRIATNLAIDRLRRRKTAGVQVDVDNVDRVGAAAPSGTAPDKRALAAQELATLTEGLDQETIAIAVMSHVDGLTQEEIAEALDLSRRTIGKKLKKFMMHTRGRAKIGPPAATLETRESTEMTGAHGN